MRSDSDIKRDVEDELRWDPNIDPTDIAVAVKSGVVTLTGFVRSYAEKFATERAAKRVEGVVGVANDLEVRLPQTDERPDPEIARDVVANLKIWLPSSWEHIKAIVKNGWVTLEGEVEWNYQREYAERAVRWIKGVRGVSNLIRLQPRISDQASIHPKWRKRMLCAFDIHEIHDLSRHSIERERLRDQGYRGRSRARARRGRIQEGECRAQGECEKRLRRSPPMTALALPNVRHKQSPEA